MDKGVLNLLRFLAAEERGRIVPKKTWSEESIAALRACVELKLVWLMHNRWTEETIGVFERDIDHYYKIGFDHLSAIEIYNLIGVES